jgi:Tol biopolymer transport system component
MNDHDILDRAQRAARRVAGPLDPYEDLLRRRDRNRRKQRVLAASVASALFVAAIWVVKDIASLDRTGMSSVPGGSSNIHVSPPHAAVGPIPHTDYLLDLDTGETTPLPDTIGDTEQRGNEYAAAPDGTRLAFTAPGVDGESHKSQVFVTNLDGTGIEQVTHDVDAAHSPAWSPDGSKIAYVGYHDGGLEDLFVLDLATGTSTQLTFATTEPDPAAPDWGPWQAGEESFTSDGSSIVYSATRGDSGGDHGEAELRMIPAAGGESVTLAEGLDGAELSPDGALLAYGSAANPGGDCPGAPPAALCVANADGTDVRVLVQGGVDAIGVDGWSPDGTRILYDEFHQAAVSIVDVTSGQSWSVAEGQSPAWLNDHTLIVERDHCDPPPSGFSGTTKPGCMG